MDLTYSDREAGNLLGVWLVALGLLALSTTRPTYTPVVHPTGDFALFGGLVGLVGLGVVVSRYRDIALGVPMAVCGGLVIWIVLRTVGTAAVPLGIQTALAALGLLGLGGLFVREGVVIARGRRRQSRQSHPSTGWQWWLGTAVLLAAGIGGL